jgi:formamidopyrimidine-DNA glycosylase
MPELPEAETIARALKKYLRGRSIKKIKIYQAALRYPLDLHQHRQILNNEITDIRRRGRYLIIVFRTLDAILVHLGMTGSFRGAGAAASRRKHEHVLFYLDNKQTLRYEDHRRFGFLKVTRLRHPLADPEELHGLGPEPLAKAFNGQYLYNQLRGRRLPIKSAVMDNKIVVGVGNIYANEALFMSGVAPLKPAGRLSRQQCGQLAADIKKILRKAIRAGGTTIADFKGLDGSEGRFSQQLRIYGRNGKKCPQCRQTRILSTRIGGRSSFYCPHCQQ